MSDIVLGFVVAAHTQKLPSLAWWEFVVAANNSTDDAPVVVDRAPLTAPMPIQYAFEPGQGVPFGRNARVAHSRGHRPAFSDDDLQLAPNLLRRHKGEP